MKISKPSFPLRSRKDLRAYFEHTICGYSARTAFYPIYFNVKLYNSLPDEEELREAVKDCLYSQFAIEDFLFFPDAFQEVYADDQLDSIYFLTIIDLRDSIDDSGFLSTDFLGTTYDVSFSLEGRSGGQLCLEYFEGLSLALSCSEDFYDSIYRDKYPDETVSEYREACSYSYEPYSLIYSLYKLTETLRYYFEEEKLHEKEFLFLFVDNFAQSVLTQMEDTTVKSNRLNPLSFSLAN